jgi:hypothetical protein
MILSKKNQKLVTQSQSVARDRHKHKNARRIAGVIEQYVWIDLVQTQRQWFQLSRIGLTQGIHKRPLIVHRFFLKH